MPNTPLDPVLLSSSDDDETTPDTSKAIVLYSPPSPTPISAQPPIPSPNPSPTPNPTPGHPRVLPAVGAFTVQCATCYKWRLIPTKEKYEEIREYILDHPFTCDIARQWRADVSCEVDTDIEQDGSRVWAIDKPCISQPPPGWDRDLRIRAEGGSKFADVYYTSPAGKRLRSMVEVRKHLLEHPEYTRQGVTESQFSFQIPKPLQENYVRKRTANPNMGMRRPLEPADVTPLSWVPPDDSVPLQLDGPGYPASYSHNSLDSDATPEKKKAGPGYPASYSLSQDSDSTPEKMVRPVSYSLSHDSDATPEKKMACLSKTDVFNSDTGNKRQKFKIKGPRLPADGYL